MDGAQASLKDKLCAVFDPQPRSAIESSDRDRNTAMTDWITIENVPCIEKSQHD
jgi:hypothetical protein